MTSIQPVMRAIQKAASATTWSGGVQLCRSGAVVVPSVHALKHDEELEVQVASTTAGAVAVVSLWPQDADWSCSCDSSEDVCRHVAAAAIACNQALVLGGQPQDAHTTPPTQPETGSIHYHFEGHQGGLMLRRTVVMGDSSLPLNITLQAFARSNTVRLLAQAHDTALDALLVTCRANEALPKVTLHKIIKLLRDAPQLFFEGSKIFVGEPQSAYRLALAMREGGAIFVHLRRAKRVRAVFGDAAALFDDTLSPLTASPLPEHELRQLKAGLVVPQERHGELFGTLLPNLRKAFAIDWGDVGQTTQADVQPVLHLLLRLAPEADGEAPTLCLLPSLHYGHPAIARVVGDTLLALGKQVPQRRREAERALSQLLQQNLCVPLGQWAKSGGSAGVDLANRVRLMASHPQVAVTDESALKAFTVAGTLVPKLTVQHGGFDLDLMLPGGEHLGRATAGAARAAFERGEPLVPLINAEGGTAGFATLPRDFFEDHGERIALLLDARAAAQSCEKASAQAVQPSLPGWLLPHLIALAEAVDAPLPASLSALQETLQEEQNQQPRSVPTSVSHPDITTEALPAGLELRPYQSFGVAWLRSRLRHGIGALLADDMGLGKTLQALLARQGRTLVVAPTSVLCNWRDEAKRLKEVAKICIYHGQNRAMDGDEELVITSFGIVRQDGGKLMEQSFETLIVDEAQIIKNAESLTAQAVWALGASIKRRLALTGTPIENRLEELWSVAQLLNPGLLGDLRQFKQLFADPIALMGSVPKDSEAHQQGLRAARALRLRVGPMLLRRTKKEVAKDLPPRTDVVLRCKLSESERAVYNAVKAATQAQIVQGLSQGGTVMQALEALLRLRQAACHSGLVPGQEAQTSSKVQLLLHTLQQALQEGHRALIFSQWTSMLDRVEPHLRTLDIRYLRLDGQTVDRAEVVRRFSDAQGPDVLLASLKAGGVGLNLTRADHVFLLDPWWNPAAEDQAADRAHRIGQQRPVLVHRLVAEDTVEENMLRLQGHKRALAAALLSDDAENAANPHILATQATLTKDDLWALVGDGGP